MHAARVGLHDPASSRCIECFEESELKARGSPSSNDLLRTAVRLRRHQVDRKADSGIERVISDNRSSSEEGIGIEEGKFPFIHFARCSFFRSGI